MSCAGLESQDIEEGVVAHGSGLSRGDKRRNERLARLRELVPPQNAILGIDLADDKQAMVVTDHDSRVLARKRVRAKTWQLRSVLECARHMARRHGFVDLTVGCTPSSRACAPDTLSPEHLFRGGRERCSAA